MAKKVKVAKAAKTAKVEAKKPRASNKISITISAAQLRKLGFVRKGSKAAKGGKKRGRKHSKK